MRSHKSKIKKLDNKNLRVWNKNLLHKNTKEQMKIGKMLQLHMTDKGLIYKMYKVFLLEKVINLIFNRKIM